MLLNKNFLKKLYLFLKVNYGACLILVFLALLFFVNRNLFISNPYWLTIDPWLYTGYFLNFESYYKMFGVLYYGTRLSWIIPGYILYKMFSTLVANYVLHFGFVAAAVLSLYYILKRTISDRAAVFTALLFAGYVYFLNEMGWDYISGPAMTFFLLTLLFLTLSIQSRYWKYHLSLAGIFCISMIYANFFMVVFLPTIIAFLFFIYLGNVKRLFYFILGIFIGSGIMELFSYLLTGNSLVIFKQLNIASYYSNILNPWWIPVETWILNASWLLLPLVVVIGCTIFLLFQRFDTKIKYSYSLFLVLNFLVTVLIFIGAHIKGNPIFQFAYYACYLIPPMFLAIGAICSGVLNSLSSRQFYFVLCFELCLLLLPYTSVSAVLRSVVLHVGTNLFFLIFVICWITFLSLSVISQKVQIKSLFILVILSAVVSMCLFNGVLYSFPNQNYPDTYENGFVSIINSVKIINDETIDQNVRFWYDADESKNSSYYGGLFNNINAVFLWGYTGIGRDFPNVDKKNIDSMLKLPRATKIVILSTKPDAFSLAEDSLGKIGYNAILVSERKIDLNKIGFNITIIRVEAINFKQYSPVEVLDEYYNLLGTKEITIITPRNALIKNFFGIKEGYGNYSKINLTIPSEEKILMKKSILANYYLQDESLPESQRIFLFWHFSSPYDYSNSTTTFFHKEPDYSLGWNANITTNNFNKIYNFALHGCTLVVAYSNDENISVSHFDNGQISPPINPLQKKVVSDFSNDHEISKLYIVGMTAKEYYNSINETINYDVFLHEKEGSGSTNYNIVISRNGDKNNLTSPIIISYVSSPITSNYLPSITNGIYGQYFSEGNTSEIFPSDDQQLLELEKQKR